MITLNIGTQRAKVVQKGNSKYLYKRITFWDFMLLVLCIAISMMFFLYLKMYGDVWDLVITAIFSIALFLVFVSKCFDMFHYKLKADHKKGVWIYENFKKYYCGTYEEVSKSIHDESEEKIVYIGEGDLNGRTFSIKLVSVDGYAHTIVSTTIFHPNERDKTKKSYSSSIDELFSNFKP